MFAEVFMVSQVLNEGQPREKDTGKEVDIGEGEKGVTLIVFRCGYFEKFLHSWTGMHCSKFNTKQVLIIVTNG